MSGIKGKNTKPELMIRSALHGRGYRYVLHDRRLPGRPDIVFPKRNAVIEVQGCFWHGHACHLFKWPKSSTEFWHEKISANVARDLRNRDALMGAGWRVAEVWECQMRGKEMRPIGALTEQLAQFLEGNSRRLVIGADKRIEAPKDH